MEPRLTNSRINVLIWWTSGNHQRLFWAHKLERFDHMVIGLQNTVPDQDSDLAR